MIKFITSDIVLNSWMNYGNLSWHNRRGNQSRNLQDEVHSLLRKEHKCKQITWNWLAVTLTLACVWASRGYVGRRQRIWETCFLSLIGWSCGVTYHTTWRPKPRKHQHYTNHTQNLKSNWLPMIFGSLFYDAFSVTGLYSVDDSVRSEWRSRIQTRTNTHALSGIQTHGLSVQEIRSYASDHAAIGTGDDP
jgi:hypothetical protein